MRLSLAVLALTSLSVLAQDLSDIPDCALKCLVDAIPATGCKVATDFACICKASALIAYSVQSCSQQVCSTAVYETVPKSIERFCDVVGVQISIATGYLGSGTLTSTSPGPLFTSIVATITTSGLSSSTGRSSSATSPPPAVVSDSAGSGVRDGMWDAVGVVLGAGGLVLAW